MLLKKISKPLAVLILILFTAAVSFASATPRKGEGGPQPLLAVGSEPIDFTLEKLGGGQAALASDLKNKVVVMVFWSLFCGPCQEELPIVDHIAKKYTGGDVAVYAVNLDGEKRAKAVKQYMDTKGFSFTVLWEQIDGIRYVTADAYGVPGTPATILIGKKGKVSYTHIGQETLEALEKAVKEGLEEK